jgi:hypothetical protein
MKQCSTTASLTEEVESLRTQPDEYLTEDWVKSILYQRVKAGQIKFNEENEGKCLTEEEILTCSYSHEDLPLNYQKAISTLEQLLVEMLGTREDADRFREKYSKCSMRSVKQLITKCQELLLLRTALCGLLVGVRHRERMFRNILLEKGLEVVKKEIVGLFRQGKGLQREIEDWMKMDPPFSGFIFRGKNYLDRIVDQNLEAFFHYAKVQGL